MYIRIWGRLLTTLGSIKSAALKRAKHTVLPSMGIPGGTKGTDPVAIMMFLAVTSPPTSTLPVSSGRFQCFIAKQERLRSKGISRWLVVFLPKLTTSQECLPGKL